MRKYKTSKHTTKLNTIDDLMDMGVLGNENTGDPDYWSWQVLQPDKLPEQLQQDYKDFGEIRYSLLK